jgi:hypothetical protein
MIYHHASPSYSIAQRGDIAIEPNQAYDATHPTHYGNLSMRGPVPVTNG